MRLTRVVVFLVLSVVLLAASASAQEVVATWTDSSGNWSNPANWTSCAPSSCPVVPNNSGSTTYSVTIGTSNAVVTMDVLNDAIDNLTLGSTDSLNIGAGNSMGLVSGASYNNGELTVNGTLSNNSDAYINNYDLFTAGFRVGLPITPGPTILTTMA